MKSCTYLFAGIILLLTNCKPAADTLQSGASDLYVDRPIDFSRELETIAFGSCNRQNLPQQFWQTILATEPDLWIWLGDNIYADTEDMELMQSKYRRQKSAPEYQLLLSAAPVIGIWDDHDYGKNDGGKNYLPREESKQLLFDFLDIPKDQASRNRKGAYQAYLFGKGERRIKIILLDTRYFRDELQPNPGGGPRYLPNQEGDLLGELQWQWLEEELKKGEAAVHLICSGIQFVPEEHFFEKWANFPAARKRFFELIAKTAPARPVLLSGDRHIAEISEYKMPGTNQIITEITSSGLTHSYEQADEPNRYRVGALVSQKNFGLLKIDWSADPLGFEIEIKGINNMTYLSHSF